MVQLVLAIFFLLLAIAGVIVRKTYYQLPVRELKRRARHEAQDRTLYRAVAYGDSLRALLWLWIALGSAASFVLFGRVWPLWLSLLAVAVSLWLSFSWLPASRVSSVAMRLTLTVTPAIAWLLNYLYPWVDRVAAFVRRSYQGRTGHTGLFERSDLVELIEQQRWQADSRLSPEELEIAKRALGFGSRKVADITTSTKDLKTIRASDTIGPVLIDELHRSGQAFAMVRDDTGAICGTLAFQSLDLHTTGQVRDVMNPSLHYLHEADSLVAALQAFFATGQMLFAVVNSAEECIGVVSLQAVLGELLGPVSHDGFDQYADLSAVAARHSRQPEGPAVEIQPEEA